MLTDARFLWAENLAKQLFISRPLVGFDVETTGPSPENDRILQLGYVRIEPLENGDVAIEEREIDINPDIPISAEATRIHGINNAKVANCPKFADIADTLAEKLTGDLVGYNLKFDVQCVEAEFQRAGIRWEPGKMLDPFRIFRMKEGRDLTAAVKFYLNMDLSNAHTALPDTIAAMRVLSKQLEKYGDIPSNVDGLHELLFETAPDGFVDVDRKLMLRDDEPVITFGKHKDKKLKDVPSDYLRWILDTAFNDQVKDAVTSELKSRKSNG